MAQGCGDPPKNANSLAEPFQPVSMLQEKLALAKAGMPHSPASSMTHRFGPGFFGDFRTPAESASRPILNMSGHDDIEPRFDAVLGVCLSRA